jgi:hypothetical protein
MILTQLGEWVGLLIDKHENENSRVCMAIMDAWTADSDFQNGEYRTGRRYIELPPEYKNWKTQDTLPIQQEADKALNIAEEEETWYLLYHPRTEFEEDKLIQQERTLLIKSAYLAMWVDRAFDMGINFGDIFRRLNKVNPRFYQNYHRGEDRKSYYSHHKKGKNPNTKRRTIQN